MHLQQTCFRAVLVDDDRLQSLPGCRVAGRVSGGQTEVKSTVESSVDGHLVTASVSLPVKCRRPGAVGIGGIFKPDGPVSCRIRIGYLPVNLYLTTAVDQYLRNTQTNVRWRLVDCHDNGRPFTRLRRRIPKPKAVCDSNRKTKRSFAARIHLERGPEIAIPAVPEPLLTAILCYE